MEVYDFGARIKNLREVRKLSQGDVATKLNLENATISGYERGVTTPSVEVLRSLALFYNVSADYLLGLTDRETIYLDDFSETDKQAVVRIIDNLRQLLSEKAGD